MVTQDYYNTASARDIEQALKQIRSSKNSIGKTSGWYIRRIQQLEAEKNSLNRYIKDCQSYLDYQHNNNRELFTQLSQLKEVYEEGDEKKLWFYVPRTWINKAFALGTVLLGIGVLLSLFGL